MPGLDRIFDFLMSIIGVFRFWVIVREGDRTVIYRLGKVRRVLEPGLYWKLFGWDYDETTSVREELWPCPAIDLITSDGQRVHTRGAFRLQVLPDKVQTFQTTLGDEHDSVKAALLGAITEAVSIHTHEQFLDPDENGKFRQAVLDAARKRLNPYGYKIYDFWFTERTSVKTLRLITGE